MNSRTAVTASRIEREIESLRSARSSAALDLVQDHLPLLVIVALYLGEGQFASHVLEWPLETRAGVKAAAYGAFLGLFALVVIGIALLCVFMLATVIGWISRRIYQSTPALPRWASITRWSDIRGHLTAFHLSSIVVVFALLGAFMNTFVGFKRAIPAVKPFSWDVDFMRLDQVLHLDRHPWELLQPLLGYSAATILLDDLYYAWFLISVIGVAGMIWIRDRTLRTQFFVAFCFTWILLGTVMAIVFSSAGPCYFDRVTGHAGPYVPLMSYLYAVSQSHDLTALWVQETLWKGYRFGTTNVLIEGISAMPSLHVALPVLYAIPGWRIHRLIGIAFAVYAMVILVGSVHLGWHYAVDGYVSILAVPAIWGLSGWGVRKYYDFLDREADDPAAVSDAG